MEHRRIGSLSVGVVGLGCNQLGTAGCDEATGVAVIREALDAGVNYFDVADEYGQDYANPSDPTGWGVSEEVLGRALAGHRQEVVIATKFGAHPHGDERRGGNSARWVKEAVHDSLRRLGTDYIDLYQAHFPDPSVPIDETLGALADLVSEGLVREIGCCNFDSTMLRQAAAASGAIGAPHLASVQNAFNLFSRSALADPIPTCAELGVAFIPYYPLASGMLTGKYRRGVSLPSDTRLTDGHMVDDTTRSKLFSDKTFARLEALEGFAAERGHTLLELAFGWLLAQPTVATVIAGAAKPGQVAANVQASGWVLTPAEAEAAVELLQRAG